MEPYQETNDFLFSGVTFSLIGYDSIPTDGSGRIVITDINPNEDNDVDALICRSERVTSERGNWYLNSNQQSTDADDRIDPSHVSKTKDNNTKYTQNDGNNSVSLLVTKVHIFAQLIFEMLYSERNILILIFIVGMAASTDLKNAYIALSEVVGRAL